MASWIYPKLLPSADYNLFEIMVWWLFWFCTLYRNHSEMPATPRYQAPTRLFHCPAAFCLRRVLRCVVPVVASAASAAPSSSSASSASLSVPASAFSAPLSSPFPSSSFSFPSWYGEPRLGWDPGWIVLSLSPFLFGTGWHEFIVCGGSNSPFLYQVDSDMNPLQTGYPEGFAWTTLIYLTCGSNWESGTFNLNKIILAMPDSSFCGTAGSCFERWSLVMLLLCGYCVYFYCVGSSSGGGRA